MKNKREKNGKTPRKRTVSPRSGADVTGHQFPPGNRGGTGRPVSRPYKDALENALKNGNLEAVTENLIRIARGRGAPAVAAAREIADRLDGKAKVSVDIDLQLDVLKVSRELKEALSWDK